MNDIETKRLNLKIPTMDEQYDLFNILRKEEVNKYYIVTPKRFNNREEFLISLNDWNKQKEFYQKKIDNLNSNDYKYTWSIFLKDNTLIGQITVQPNSNYLNDKKIRDIGWFMDPKYQRNGYMFEVASVVLDYIFKEERIERIETLSAAINISSWKLMEKLGFKRIGETNSPYLDDNGNYLLGYSYILTKEMYLNKKSNGK